MLGPGAPCLLCRQVIDAVTARDESLRRRHPEEYERRKREGYIRGGGEPAPAVVTFTTATACIAVDELLQALTQFRGSAGSVWQMGPPMNGIQHTGPATTVLVVNGG